MTYVHYQLLAYRPYAFGEEWVAVGFVAYAPSEGSFVFMKAPRFDRVAAMFPNADVDALRRMYLPHIDRQLDLIVRGFGKRDEIPFKEYPKSVSEISDIAIPKNDSSLNWRVEKVMRGENFAWVVDFLRKRIFDEQQKNTNRSPTDEYVWLNSFKPNLLNEVNNFESDYAIPVGNRYFSFDYALQNGSLHLIDPACFALSKKQSVLRKLDQRYGKYAQVANAFPGKRHTIYVPAELPQDLKENKLIRNTLENEFKQDNLEVSVFGVNQVNELRSRLQSAVRSARAS